MSELSEPLRKLLKKDAYIEWSHEQDDVFSKIKQQLTTAPVLKFYDVNKQVTLSVDASSKSVGAALMQENQPVAYGTKSLTSIQEAYP